MIESIDNKTEKQKITKAILDDNKAFFGIEEAVQMYIDAVKTQIFFAYEVEDEVLGFISLKKHYESSLEIFVMAINKKRTVKG